MNWAVVVLAISATGHRKLTHPKPASVSVDAASASCQLTHGKKILKLDQYYKIVNIKKYFFLFKQLTLVNISFLKKFKISDICLDKETIC